MEWPIAEERLKEEKVKDYKIILSRLSPVHYIVSMCPIPKGKDWGDLLAEFIYENNKPILCISLLHAKEIYRRCVDSLKESQA